MVVILAAHCLNMYSNPVLIAQTSLVPFAQVFGEEEIACPLCDSGALGKGNSSLSKGAFLNSVQFSPSVMSDSLRPHKQQHARLPCPSPTPGACSNSCPSSHWCHPTISSSVVPFSSCLQSFPESGSFPMSQFYALGGQSIGASASASVLFKFYLF